MTAPHNPAVPTVRERALSRITSHFVRAYVLDKMIEPSIQRMFDVGHGITKFDVPVAVGVKNGGTALLQVEAPADVQVRALAEIIAIGIPPLRGGLDGPEAPVFGVMILPALEDMAEARRRAEAHRIEDHGMGDVSPPGAGASGRGGYVPPPGHDLVVVEDDFSHLSAAAPAVPAAPPSSSPPAQPLTKAQQIAARRRATSKR